MGFSTINCENCKKDFEAKSKKAMFCCNECRLEYNVKKRGNLNTDYVICQVCKRAVASVTGIHMKTYHPEYTVEIYKKEFPGFLTNPLALSERKKVGARKAGALMREDHHRERLSNSVKGENNPMHKNKTSDEFRRSISPFTPDFYRKRFPHLSEEECEKMAKEKNRSVKKRSWTQVSYWIEKGYSEEEAKSKVTEVQKTFSLDICIEKYGLEKGTERWKERQRKWIEKVFNEETYIGGGKSMICDKFIENLASKINPDYKILTGKDEKFIRCSETKRAYKYDLTICDLKKIIEFNGDYWHCNPLIWKPEDINKSKGKSAKEIWEYDDYKYKLAERHGYKVFTVWELDYINDPEGTIKKCIEFIYDKEIN